MFFGVPKAVSGGVRQLADVLGIRPLVGPARPIDAAVRRGVMPSRLPY